MKKLSILLLGALIAMTALQGCSKDETTTPDQAVDQTTTDTPSQPSPWAPDGDGRIPIAKVELALGGGSGDEPVFNIIHNPSYTQVGNLAETPDSIEFGIGVMDVTVTGQGIAPAGGACPNSIDPATGLPWAVDPCAGNRGTFLAGVLSANLTITNITGAAGSLAACADPMTASCHDWTAALPKVTTCDDNAAACTEGSLGACDGFNYTDGLVNAFQDMPNSICVYNRDCSPRRALVGAVPPLPPLPINKNPAYAYCMGSIVTVASVGASAAGFCENGSTVCAAAQSDDDGQNTVCGAGTCSNSVVENCLLVADCPLTGTCSVTTTTACNVDANCPALETCSVNATCNGAAPVGIAECWTGCGACINGRDLNCVGVQYTGSMAQGGPTDLDALGLVKCSGGPYTANAPDIAALNMWMVGNPTGLDMGMGMPFTLQINSSNSSYCIHTFTVWEDPFGDASYPECRPTCGDGYIAAQSATAESCEPVDDRSGMNTDRGCGTFGGANPCSLKGVCSDNGAACNCGPNNDVCGDGDDNLLLCAVPGTATCNAAVAKDCVCDPVTCGAGLPTGCVDLVTTCGNSILDVGEACDPGIDPVCCNVVTCQAAAATQTCGGAPAGICDAQDTCNGLGVGAAACVANFAPAITVCLAAGANATCDPADTCDGAGNCPANVAGAIPCGGALTEPDCNPDVCNGAGACTDVAILPDLSVCNDNGGINCCSGICAPGVCPTNCTITGLTTRGNGSPGKHTFAIDAGGGFADPIGPIDLTMSYDGSHLPTIDYFMSFPNEAGMVEASTGQTLLDLVWYNVQQDNANADCTTAPRCFVGATGATEVVQGGNLYATYAAGPDLGIRGTMQPLLAGSNYPNFAAISAPMIISCCPGGSALCGGVYDAGPANTVATSLTIDVGLADGGGIDMIIPAAGGTVRVIAFGYCAHGGACDAAVQGGEVIQNAQWGYFFDNTKFSTVLGDFVQQAPQKGLNPGNSYSIDPSCRTGSTGMDMSQRAAGFVIAGSDSNTNFCEWHMANLHMFTMLSLAQAAGTISTISTSMWSSNGTTMAFPNDAGYPCNASIDAAEFDRDVTNGEATVLWQ